MARRLVLLAVAPLALVLGLSVVLIGSDCPEGAAANPGTLSREAERAIPRDIAEIYVAMAARWNIDVAFLASIGAQETDHGRIPTTNEVNASGCQGLMQLGVGGACGDYWGRNKCDGNDDGRHARSPTSGTTSAPQLAACGATKARRPRAVRRPATTRPPAITTAPARTAPPTTRTRSWPARSSTASSAAVRPTLPACRSRTTRRRAGAADVAIAAGDGEFIVDPGANRPGADLAPELVGFVRRMAEFLPRPPIVTTGTNHSPTTTSGSPSDHWTGHAADFGSVRNGFPASGGGYGDEIALAAFLAAGEPIATARANARRGGALHDPTRRAADPDHLEDAARRQPLRPRSRRGTQRGAAQRRLRSRRHNPVAELFVT